MPLTKAQCYGIMVVLNDDGEPIATVEDEHYADLLINAEAVLKSLEAMLAHAAFGIENNKLEYESEVERAKALINKSKGCTNV